MLLSQRIAGFTKGEADVLRKAMGKKQRDVLDKMKPKFITQAKEKGHPEDKLEKIWKDWEAFAEYAFNKSHSTCYSLVAYQTAYLKANYPADFMAAVLTHNQSKIDKLTLFMEECRNIGVKVLGPHLNESGVFFRVNKEGEIRFGMGAIKGTGEAAVQAIIAERNENGDFTDIFDFTKRVNLKAVNKKTIEVLAMSGALDCFEGIHRRQYLYTDDNEPSLIEKAIKYASRLQMEEQSAQVSLFGGDTGTEVPLPRVMPVEPFGKIEMLNIEKDVVGLYISGHPLDQYKLEMEYLCNTKLSQIKKPEEMNRQAGITVGGIITNVSHRVSKNGKPYGVLTIEDYEDSLELFLFSDKYVKFKQFMEIGWYIYIKGGMKPKWGRETELEFDINDMDLLGNVREKLVKGVELRMHLKDINHHIVNELKGIAEAHPGKCQLKLQIFSDFESNPINLEMISRKMGVEPTDELFSKLKKLDEVAYSVVC
jgi:DNA polymerase-3 subunit alpha